MNLILSGPIDESLQRRVVEIARPAGVLAQHTRARRLEKVQATSEIRLQVATLCNSARVDHAFTDSAPGFTSIGMVAMDMDSTLITIECIDEIADFVGKKKEVSAITEMAMRGELRDFAESLRRRVALLAGTSADVLSAVFEHRTHISPGGRELIAAAKKVHAHTVLVSGGFTYFTNRLKSDLHLDESHANTLEIIDGRLTGKIIDPIIGPLEKAGIVEQAMRRQDQKSSGVIVIGDGSNDIPMMNLVQNSVAYYAKPAVVLAANHAVRYGSLATVIDFFS